MKLCENYETCKQILEWKYMYVLKTNSVGYFLSLKYYKCKCRVRRAIANKIGNDKTELQDYIIRRQE